MKEVRFLFPNARHFLQSTLFFIFFLCYYRILILLRAALFWDFTQRRMVVFLGRFGKIYRTLEDGTQ